MNPSNLPSGAFQDLLDEYLSGTIDETGLERLEQMLAADADARRQFVRYSQMHTDLYMLVRARRGGERVLRLIEQDEAERLAGAAADSPARVDARPNWLPLTLGVAAGFLLALGFSWWLARGQAGLTAGDEPIAWLVNAQNCSWDQGAAPAGGLRAGQAVSLKSGLAELRFSDGATVVLEGPAAFEPLTRHSARLLRGKLAARVPDAARGFQIISPKGKIVDLGTEFGVAVADDGSTDVHVFSGKVEAYAGGGNTPLHMTQSQSAQITSDAVTLRPDDAESLSAQFVRAITPPPAIVPRGLVLDFKQPAESALRDRDGRATGLTHRLPGTGRLLPDIDGNLHLNPVTGSLELTTTRSDINTQNGMDTGEYLGVRLCDLGFTGREDFEITVTVPNIPSLKTVGQFGLYAGVRSDRNIRGGLISLDQPDRYGQFLVNNNGGRDSDLVVLGLLSSGDDLRLTLRRVEGRYALGIENLTAGSTSTLTIPHPEFLDAHPDLYVGFFGANTQSDLSKTLIIREVAVTVWTQAHP